MRRVVALLAVGGMALGAASAQAAIDKGKFTGETSAADPMGLKVTKKHAVKAFFYDGVHLKCTDGDSLDTPTGSNRIQTPNSVTFPISKKKRKWHIRARDNENGVGWDAFGKFNKKGTKVHGTLSVFATFNQQNQQDPNGDIRCEVKNLPFTLKRK